MSDKRLWRSGILASALLMTGLLVWAVSSVLGTLLSQAAELETLKERLTASLSRPRPSIEALEARYRTLASMQEAERLGGFTMTDEQASSRLQTIVREVSVAPVILSSLRLAPPAHERTMSFVRGTATLRAPAERVFQTIRAIERANPLLTIESLRTNTTPAPPGSPAGPQVDMTLTMKLYFVRANGGRTP